MLALSGVAFGAVDATTLNKRVDTLIAHYGGSVDNYTLTFTLDGGLGTGSIGFLRLNDNWGLFAQQNRYLGITLYNNSTWSNPSDWRLKGIEPVDNDNQHCLLDAVEVLNNDPEVQKRKEAAYNQDFAPLTEGLDQFWLIDTGDNGLTDITIQLTAIVVGEAGGMTILNITNPDGEYYVTNSIGSALDLSEINFEVAGAAASLTVGENIHDLTKAVIPEPTTATLSLLALAGLAARRRRK